MKPDEMDREARKQWADEQMAQFKKRMATVKAEGTANLLEFLGSLAQEGERSAVVLGAERVNVAVEELLKAYLTPSPDKKDKLFENDGALASFSRKTEVACRLGLMDLEFKQALDLVRRLRNDFAHAVTVEKLSDQEHSDRVKALVKMMTKSTGAKTDTFIPAFGELSKQVSKPCQQYLSCIMVLLVKLELVRGHVERAEVKLPAKLTY